MKLEYINPAIIVKEVKLTQMIALSKYDDEPATGDDALSREFNDFGEDDDNRQVLTIDDVWED